MYHCVHDEPYTENTALFVRPSELESHLQALVDNDIQCLFADEFGPVDKNSVIMTFDDGYVGQDRMMLPRYAILRGCTREGFLRFVK